MSRYLELIRERGAARTEGEKSERSEESLTVHGRSPDPVREKSERSEKRVLACTRCGRPLVLPESQALGKCVRCMSDAEWTDTLARMALRRERTKQAVERRKAELRKEAA